MPSLQLNKTKLTQIQQPKDGLNTKAGLQGLPFIPFPFFEMLFRAAFGCLWSYIVIHVHSWVTHTWAP